MAQTLQQLHDDCVLWLFGRAFPSTNFFLGLVNEVSSHFNVGLKRGGEWMIPPLRVSEMETTVTLTVSATAGVFDLPEDFLEVISLRDPNDANVSLEYISRHDRVGPIKNTEFTIIVDQIHTFVQTASLTLTYYKKVENNLMDMVNDTNVVLTNHPHILRHGVLSLAFGWEGRPDDRASVELSLCGWSVEAWNQSAKNRRTKGSTLRSR